MKLTMTAITTILLFASTASAYGEIPDWVKTNAGWWADGTITESEFLSGIEFLIKNDILVVPSTAVSSESSEGVPDWVKTNAGWWADGTITDSEFVNGIQHLIKTGLISVSANPQTTQMISEAPKNTDSELAALEAELEKCSEIKKPYDRLNCERTAKHEITAYNFKIISQSYQAGPVVFFWPGIGTEGNSFEITSSGQAMLRLRILVENTGSQTEALFCTGPAVCNYDVTNGVKDFKYSGMDFTNGQIVVKPGETKMFNMFFGPNIGGGGTTFEYDPEKNYYFRGSESFGSVYIPLNLG
ncbi:MAG: peptidase [Nitrosopumilus sp.]|nr:peptidase [Nitrosopumilus sp.]MDH5659275.1 peptidase [Nitrosopumilus sp.]